MEDNVKIDKSKENTAIKYVLLYKKNSFLPDR